MDQSIRKARLALKHKRNPKQTRRIVVIVASPVREVCVFCIFFIDHVFFSEIETDQKSLVRVAKDLKKNKLAVTECFF